MEAIKKENFLISAKSKAHKKQYSKLIISDDQIYTKQIRQLYEILVSQYATIIKQDTFSIFQDFNQKYPLPIAYACLQFAFQSNSIHQCLKILHRNLQKQYHINNHIISFNIANLYKQIGNTRKSLFYLELLLKENPIFEDGVYEYCLILLQDNRKQQIIRIINRYLLGQLPNSEKLQCLYLYVVSKSNESDKKQLLNLFHKKKISPITTFNLGLFLTKMNQKLKAIEVFKELQQLLMDFHQSDDSLKNKKLLIMVKINLIRLYSSKPQYYQKCLTLKQQIQNITDIVIDDFIQLGVGSFIQKQSQEQIELVSKIKQKQNIRTQRIHDRFTECRNINKKKLAYLLKKQHKMSNFLKKMKLQKDKSILHCSLMSQNILNLAKKQLINSQFDSFEKSFQQKKQLHRLNYNHQQLEKVINDYFNKNIKIDQRTNDNIQEKKKYTHSKSKEKFRIKKGNGGIGNEKVSETKSMEKKINKFDQQQLTFLKTANFEIRPEKMNENMTTLQTNEFEKSLNIGIQYQNKNQWQEAYEHYIKMYKQFKKIQQKQQILIKIAHVFENSQNYVDAEKTYIKCCKFNNAKAFLNLGCMQIKIGRLNEGVQNIEKANCIERFNTQIQTKLVYGYSLCQSTIDKAYSLATNILKRKPQSLETLIMTTNILQKQGKIKEALQIAHAIDRHKQSLQMKYYIGLLYLNDSNITMAYEYFQKALKLKPDHAPSLIEIATIISDVKPSEAINILKKVLQYDQNNRLALARLGKIYQAVQNDYENAMLTYKKSLDIEKNYQTYIKIGDVFRKKQSIVEAYVNYKQALALKQTPQAYQKLGQIYDYQKQYKKAYDSYQSALSILSTQKQNFEERRRILQHIGTAALLNKDYENSVMALTQAIQIQQSLALHIKLGDGYYGKQQYSQALKQYQTALKMTQDCYNIEVLQKIALCFDRKQQYLASKAIYQKILSIDPSNVKCLTNLANILLIIGNTNEAFYWFENMLAKVPNNIQKRLRVADIYGAVGDWSKVENHLIICYKQKQNDVRVIEKLINLYKEKRQLKQIQKFQKKLALLKANKR